MDNDKCCILISQVWLNEERYIFREMLEIATIICRNLNPNSFIILSGSGTDISNKTRELCDKVLWKSENTEFPGNGFPEMISRGLSYAKSKGYKYVFKFRGDAIIYRRNICSYCLNIINKESKSLLISQESTFNHWLGDMVIFGKVDVLIELFNPDFWLKAPKISGNYALAKRYKDFFKIKYSKSWISSLRLNCSFRDIPSFKWVDLRFNHNDLLNGKKDLYHLSNKDQINYYWGKKSSVHIFDENNFVVFNKINWIQNWIYEYNFYKKSNKYININSLIRKYIILCLNYINRKFYFYYIKIYLKKILLLFGIYRH